MGSPNKRQISPKELRDLFNSNGYLKRIASGELIPRIGADHHPSPPKAFEPFCTRSQFISYFDADGNKVCSVHQYKRADGTIGASGRPDPKEVYLNGTIYYV